MATKRNTRNTEPKRSIPWGPMFISFLVGAFIMFLMHIKDTPVAEKTDKKVVEKKVEKKNKAIEPTFEFYTLLPEMEVVVDTPTKSKQAIVTLPTKELSKNTDKTNESDNVSYLLQVGSFRKAGDADAYKAKLAFLGVESKVQKVTIDNKDTWHRVQVGPIVGRVKADALQKQLKQNNIDSLLMRAKNG